MKRRIISLILIITMMLTLVFSMSGCSSNDDNTEDGNYELYYINKEGTKLETISYTTDTTNVDELMTELIDAMNKDTENLDCAKAKPDSVSILKEELVDNTAYITFDAAYTNIKKSNELLYRAALVLTLSQITGIDYVGININDQPLTDSEGNVVGNMKAADFVDSTSSSINSYYSATVTLYYANSKGDKLKTETYDGVYSNNVSLEKYIVERLIKGPTVDGLQRTLPEDIKILSIITKDGVCYVNFDSKFLTEISSISDEVAIYSIVNSLSELTYINKVQISVDSETNVKFHNSISLNEAFSRNLDIVVNTSESE